MMVGLRTLLLLAVVGMGSAQYNATVEVEGLGTLVGSTAQTTYQEQTFYQFLGVPYATATVRFQEPTPVTPWPEVKDATVHGPACVQFGATADGSRQHPAAEVDTMAAAATALNESEDCLTLDIYTRNLTASFPVLVYVHGGAFVVGSSQDVNPGFLLDYDIVLVALQYRLGPLGFLSFETDEAPGNAGLMDQLAALQWVHDHIAQFGGDPTKVTVSGGSAGAASVALLQLSPLSSQPDELFQQVYLESGSALAPWSVEDEPAVRATVIAVSAGCNNSDTMTTCLQDVSVEALKTGFVMSAIDDMLTGGTGLGGALPVVQKAGKIKVLEEKPLTTIKGNSFRGLPMLVGVAKHEGIMPLGLLTIYKQILDIVYADDNFYENKTANDLVRRVMMIDDNRVATDAVAEKYFKPGTLANTEAMEPSLIDLAGAVHFKGPALTTVEYNSKTGNKSFLYSFNHQDVFNFEAVNHGGDFPYLFPTVELSTEEQSVSQQMVQLLVNFVTYGDPTAESVSGVPSWRPYTVKDPSFMLVDQPMQLRQDFERQLTIAATEGLRKTSSAENAIASLALLVASVVAGMSLN